MIQREAARARAEVRQSSADRAKAVRGLIGVSEVKLPYIPHSRGSDRQLVALDQRAVNGERQERIGIPNAVGVEKILGVGVKMIHVDRPAVNRNRQPDLVLLTAF